MPDPSRPAWSGIGPPGRTPGGPSIRRQLIVAFVALAVGATALIALVSYRTHRTGLEAEVLRAVTLAAEVRHYDLLQLLRRRQDRMAVLLATMEAGAGPAQAGAVVQRLAGFMATEGAEGLLYGRRGEPAIYLGHAILDAPPGPGRLARFEVTPAGRAYYIVANAAHDDVLVLRYRTDDLDLTFLDQYAALGRTGESLLLDAHGYVVSPAPALGGERAVGPLVSGPITECLAGGRGQVIAPTHSGNPAVQAFRYVNEIGGGCVLVQVDQAEALEAASDLGQRLTLGAILFGALALGLSLVLAGRISRPIGRLAEAARTLQAGDLERPIPVEGPEEIREFAEAFSVMARSIQTSRAEMAGLLASERVARAEAEGAQRRAAFLVEAGTVLGSSLEHEKTLAAVARLVVPAMADLCVVDLLEPQGSIRRLAAEYVNPAYRTTIEELLRQYPPDPRGAHPVPRVLATGRSLMAATMPEADLPKLFTDPGHLQIARKLGYRSYMVVPLIARERVFGTVSFVSTESDREYGPADLVLAEELGRRAATAVDNARLYQEAQRASRAKDDFLATVSHELRTPLNAMLGWTRLLRVGELDGAGRDRALETIERNLRVQVQLIEDLLDVSRIITGKLHLAVRRVELASVIEGAIEAVRPAADAKGIPLELVLERGGVSVTGDPDRLQQIVWNLLSNAIKFTPDGGRVTVRLVRAGTSAHIAVRDTGAGISAEFLPYVFDRFRQADATTTRAHGGLGVGLAIVRHLTELHGGTVQVESAGSGQGATFTVRLPIRPVPLQPEALASGLSLAAERVPAGAAPSLAGIRVLFVDDDRDTRELMGTVLRFYGAEVQTAASVAQAIAAVNESAPDVLVSDIAMPGQDGYTLLQQVRRTEAERGGRIKAVALTAYSRHEDRVRALQAGFETHLAKPIDPAELAAVVAAVAGASGASTSTAGPSQAPS